MGNKGSKKVQDKPQEVVAPDSNETWAWTVKEKGAPLEYCSHTMQELGDNDVQIKVTHNGLCHTDCHMRDNDWGVSDYPLVPGHEVVGEITHAGKSVTKVRVGQRVGVGWIKDSCGDCIDCKRDFQNTCRKGYDGLIVGVGTWSHPNPCGGFAENIRVNENFAFPIPKDLSSAHAAPLLCAGATVYNPIATHVKKGMKVAVVGIGGLGHMALKMAVAITGGDNVTAVSTSDKKRDLAKKCGANGYITTKVDEKFEAEEGNEGCFNAEFKAAQGSFDIVLNTVPFKTDYSKHISLLGFGAKYILVGLPVDNVTCSIPALVFQGQQIIGSIVAGRKHMLELFEFCMEHKILPEVEETTMDQINVAMDDIMNNKIPFRYVLKHSEKKEAEPVTEEEPEKGATLPDEKDADRKSVV